MLSSCPKLLESLRGYDRATFLSDLAAGVTVGVIALPLAIEFATASGVEPSRGLWPAIIAGVMLAVMGVLRTMENSVWITGN